MVHTQSIITYETYNILVRIIGRSNFIIMKKVILMDRQTVKTLKWISGGFEAFLGIPIIGGSVVLGFGWTPLVIMLAFHILVVIFSKKVGVKVTGNIIGIVTSVIGWIPIVGMFMHIISAIFILLDAASKDKNPDIIEMSK